MRIHDLEPVADRETDRPGRRTRMWIVLAVLVVAAAAATVIVVCTSDRSSPAPGKPAPRDPAAILAGLDLPDSDRVVPCAPTERIRDFARTQAAGKSGESAIGVLFDALERLSDEKRWTPHRQREPRHEPPLTADALLERLTGEHDTAYEATSYEMACLLLAASRAAGADTRLARIHSFAGEKSPADPGGKLGRFGVVSERDAEKLVFDPHGRRKAAKASVDILDDAAAAAPWYAHRALSYLAERDTARAMTMNDAAFRLAPGSADLHTVRGLVFAASGAPAEALAELEKAVKARDDATTRTNLAEILLLADPSGRRAEAELHEALRVMPECARAHATLGMVHLMRNEIDEATSEVARAEELDPQSPTVAMFWAQIHAARGDAEKAIAKGEEAVRLSGNSLNTRLGLAGLYRALARFDEMRALLKQILSEESSPSLAAEIKRLFGYEPDEPDAGATGAGAGSAAGGLKLQSGLLGEKTGGLGRGRGLGSGLGGGLDPGLGPGSLGRDLDLKLKNE